jgi:oligoendopeptidase F
LLLDEEQYGWSRVPHIVYSPFYCYNYTLSNVIVLSLIHQYKTDHVHFTRRYRQFLQAGGSLPPDKLLDILHLDLTDSHFYTNGFQVLEELLQQFTKLKSEWPINKEDWLCEPA